MPTNVKQLRGFLCLIGFYRRFIKNYASLAYALTELLKKVTSLWNTEAQTASVTLRKAMTEAPVLQLPDFTKAFLIQIDASGTSMGAVLTQNAHPIFVQNYKIH